MESHQLELTPHGVVICRTEAHRDLAAFAESESAGLISIGGKKLQGEVDGSVLFWREFSGRLIRALCHVPAGDAAKAIHLDAPNLSDLSELILNAPPMRGAEYLSAEILMGVWGRLQTHVEEQILKSGGLAKWLETYAPLWSRVGRVTLHLAENKGNPEFPFAFMASYASGLSNTGRLQQLPLGQALQEYAGAKNKSALLKLLEPLHSAAKRSPLIADLLETSDIFHPLVWLPQEAYAFLKDIPAYEDSGLLVRLPNWWKKKGSRPQVAVTIGGHKKGGLGVNALLQFQLDVVIDGHRLTRDEVTALLAGEDGLVLLRGQWVEVDREKLQQALTHWEAIEQRGDISFAEGMRLLAGAPADLKQESELEAHREWSFAQPGEWLKEVLDQLRNPAQSIPPKTLNATLRPYQESGLNWLWLCAQTGLGACLADDMGLGKTIQVLAALLRKKSEEPASKPALLVVPASLIGNWKREAARFAPSLRLFVAHGSERNGAGQSVESADLVMTTYGMLTRLEWPAKTDWSWVILDEAQAIKNHSTRQSKAVRALKADARFALTGTPIENRLGDLWALFDFLNPGLLGNASR